MKAFSYLRAGLVTTGNIVWYAATSGRYLSLEGRVRGGVFQNWARRFRYAPTEYARPTTEAEIVELVKSARSLRVFGSGHSFNDAIVSDDLLVSLDHFSGLVAKDLERQQITVKGGTRIRDVVRLLADEGLAFQALPSHDAQSIGGILSTDVHGTGRDWGFVSESVVRLTLVDGTGRRAQLRAVGRAVPRRDRRGRGGRHHHRGRGAGRAAVQRRAEGRDEGPRLRSGSTSTRCWPRTSTSACTCTRSATRCQVNTWNRTDEEQSPRGDLREFLKISLDALLAAWVGNFLAYARLLPLSRLWARVSFISKRGSNLVLESNKAFNRSIYHLHQEVEFTVPYEETFEACDRFMKLYEQLYRSGLPYTLIELRFTPEIEDRTMIGAGRGRRSTWIDLLTNDSDGFEIYYAAAEKLICEIGARPHLGKFCEGVDQDDMAEVHGESFSTFLGLVAKHDPDRKFTNAFTRRLLKLLP